MANELTRTSNADLVAAQEVVRRHADEAAQAAGGHAAAVASSPELRAIDAEIDAITQLAHTGRLTDSDEYQRRQSELIELVERKSALLRGGGARSAASKTAVAAARAGSPVPAHPSHYPALPEIGQPPELYEQDATVWGLALPKLLKAGITVQQASQLARIAQEAQADGEALQEERRQHVQAQSIRELRARYGAGYQADVQRANQHVKTLLPDGASRQLCATRLADGSTLGDNPLFVRLMIEITREHL